MKTILRFLSIVGLLVTASHADTVFFKSGDRLTGTVKEVKDGKMLFTSKVAGAVVLKMEDIRTFETDEPVEVVLDDGTTAQLKANALDGGGIEAVADGQARTLALEQIAKVNPEKVRWTGALVASYMQTDGNSVNRSATIMANAGLRTEDTRTTLDAGYFYSQQKVDGVSETSADNFFLGGKFDYFWSKQLYTYANARYYKDKILDLDHRLTTGVGLGYQWVETDSWNIFTELGATYVDEKYADPGGEKNSYPSLRGAYHVEKNFGERFSLLHNFEILESLDDTDSYLITTDAGARAQITARWFVEARALLLYNSQPPGDRKKDDTRYTLGVGLKF